MFIAVKKAVLLVILYNTLNKSYTQINYFELMLLLTSQSVESPLKALIVHSLNSCRSKTYFQSSSYPVC